MFCFGALHGAVIGKMLDVYFKDSIFKYPVAVIAFYCMSRTLTYYKNYVLLDKDPLTYLTGEEAERLKRALILYWIWRDINIWKILKKSNL